MITQLKRIDINLCEGVAYGERVHIRGDGEERVAAEMERQLLESERGRIGVSSYLE